MDTWSKICCLIIICACVFKSLKLAYMYSELWSVHGKIVENDGRYSESKLLNTELSKNGSLSIREKSKTDNSGDSAKYILINSYMRSGSTFLGQVLGFRKNTFYYYEPLHKLWIFNYTRGTQLCDFKKPFCEYRHGALETGLNFVSDVFNCKLQNHSEKLNQPLIRGFSGPKWYPLNNCVAQHREVKGCLIKVEEQCMSTRYRVVKVLRMSLADAALLLTRHPNLVIVQLFRDPRGILNSHIKTSWFPMKKNDIDAFVNDTKANCKRIRDDLVMGKTLKTNFPDRVRFVQYEDIYGNVEKTKTLIRLLGMDIPSELDKFRRSPTARRLLGTVDFNNLSGPFRYRLSLPFEYIRLIDKECKDVLRMLGLKSYETEADLHDRDFNPVDGHLPFKLHV